VEGGGSSLGAEELYVVLGKICRDGREE